jgi:hypothetical protein
MSAHIDSPAARSRPATWRVALLIFLLSGTFWLGGAHIRAMIGNDLLKFGTLTFIDPIAPAAEAEIYRLLSLASLSVIGGYVLAFASSIVFLATSPFRLRDHGWLMVSAILFYLFVPVEAYTMYLDSKMIYAEFMTTVDNQVFRELFIARVTALAGTPFIATLCYYTIIVLAVFQPMKKPRPA